MDHECSAEGSDQSVDHVLEDDGGERRVRVGPLDPGVGDEAVGRLREVDAVPADVRVGVVAGGGAGEPARRAHVVVVRPAAAAARPQSAALVACSAHTQIRCSSESDQRCTPTLLLVVLTSEQAS